MSKKSYLSGRKKVDMTFREVKNQKDKTASPQYIKVKYPVWVLPRMTKSVEFVEWPEFKTDVERINYMSRNFKHKSISELFEQEYGVKLDNINTSSIERVNTTPQELRVGDITYMSIASCNKDATILGGINLKQNIASNTNLYRFENFRKMRPTGEIPVKVVSVNRQRVTVDPLAPMLDEWLKPITDDPDIQKVMGKNCTIKVKDLHLTNGGFVGRAVIPNISKYVGEDYTIEAFIPGSQIVLNIEKDFTKWEGKTVDAFVTSYIPKPNTIGQMSLVCSVKENLKFMGEQNLINIFGHWCDDDEEWGKIAGTTYHGIVTGVINSSKKCGVFVEVPELHITGMVPMAQDKLVNYKPQMDVAVKLTDIEEPSYFDEEWKQVRHGEPYVIEDGVLKECNIKPVLQFA